MSNTPNALSLIPKSSSIKGKEKFFHNWYEKDPISGITECRIWNYEEFKTCCSLMDSFS
jgi:hypothetical protein